MIKTKYVKLLSVIPIISGLLCFFPFLISILEYIQYLYAIMGLVFIISGIGILRLKFWGRFTILFISIGFIVIYLTDLVTKWPYPGDLILYIPIFILSFLFTFVFGLLKTEGQFKVNLKQFLKPTLSKATSFIIVIGIILIINNSKNPITPLSPSSTLEKISSNFFPYNYLLGQFYGFGTAHFSEICFHWKGLELIGGVDISYMLFSVLLGLFLTTYYSLACSLIYTFNKIKNLTR